MNFDYIFILTYGRSGSTLLQGILNSIPGVLVRGENQAALRHLAKSWNAVAAAHEKHGPKSAEPVSPWFGIGEADPDAFGNDLAASFVSNVLRPEPNTKVPGFKEIRYYQLFQPDIELTFMRRFFSRAAFVVNTRELKPTIESCRKRGFKITPEDIRNADRVLRSLEGDDVFHVHYDDYNGRPEALEDMFDFLGARFDSHQIASIMNVRHSVMKANQSAVSA